MSAAATCWVARLPLSTQFYAALAATLGVECATKAHVARRAAPVSEGKDHCADGANEKERAEDGFGEPEERAVFGECEWSHHSKEEHYHDELLPEPLCLGIPECDSLLVGVLHSLSFARPNLELYGIMRM